jgi:hypothetical protein
MCFLSESDYAQPQTTLMKCAGQVHEDQSHDFRVTLKSWGLRGANRAIAAHPDKIICMINKLGTILTIHCTVHLHNLDPIMAHVV